MNFANLFTFPKWGKGDRGAVDEDVKKFEAMQAAPMTAEAQASAMQSRSLPVSAQAVSEQSAPVGGQAVQSRSAAPVLGGTQTTSNIAANAPKTVKVTLEEKYQTNYPAPALVRSEGNGVERVEVNSFADSKKGTVYLSNGQVAPMNEVAFDNDAELEVYQAAMNYDTEIANAMINGYSGSASYIRAFDYYYNLGKSQNSFDYANTKLYSKYIGQTAARAAFTAGQSAAAAETAQRREQQKARTIVKADEYFVMDESTGDKLTKSQQAQLSVMKSFANNRKQKVMVVEKIDSGKTNAYYDPETDTVVIALNAKGKAYLYWMGHEIVHRIKEQNIDDYNKLEKLVLEHLEKDSEFDLEQRIRSVHRSYLAHGQQLSRSECIEEIVANAVPTVFADEAYVQQIVQEDRSLVQKILDWVKEFIDDLKSALAGIEKSLPEAKAIQKDLGVMQSIKEVLDAALSETEGVRASEESAQKYSANEYWKPKLTDLEWQILNSAKIREVETSDKIIDSETKWLYTTSRGASVFAIYSSSTNHLDDPTVLYAVGGKTAINEAKYMEAIINGTDTDGKMYGRLVKSLPNLVKGKIQRRSNAENRRPKSGDNSVFGRELSELERGADRKGSGKDLWSEEAALLNTLKNAKYSINEEDVAEAKQRIEDLSVTVEKQQEIIRDLQAQFKLTEGHKQDRKSIEALSKKILKNHKSTYNVQRLTDDLYALFDYIANDELRDWETIMEVATTISNRILKDSETLDKSEYEKNKDLRDYLRNNHFRIPDEIRAEVSENYGGWNEFRRRNFGRWNLTNKGTTLDAHWKEMVEMFPGFFTEDATEQDQVVEVMAAFDAIQPQYVNPYEMNMDEASYDLALQIFDSYFDIPEVETFADKKNRELQLMRAKLSNKWLDEKEKIKERYDRKLLDLRNASNQKIKDLTEKYNAAQGETKEYYRNMIKRLREQSNDRLLKQRAKLNEQKDIELKRARDLRVAAGIKGQIRRIMQEFYTKLSSNTPDKHIPRSLVKSIIDLCEVIESGYDSEKLHARLDKVKIAYADMQADGDGSKYVDEVTSEIEWLKEYLDSRKIKELGVAELREIYDVLKTVRKVVNTANSTFKLERKASIAQLGEAVCSELRKEKYKAKIDSKLLDVVNKFGWSILKPVYAFRMIGSSTLQELYTNLRNGEDVWARDMQEARDVYLAAYKKANKGSWNMKTSETFKTERDEEFQITLQQKMSLYALSKRAQAISHITEGGITFEDDAATGKGPIKRKSNRATAVQLTINDLMKVVGSLTPEQRQYVDEMQKYLSTDLSAKGNEVTRALYDIDKFKEKNYFPIKSNNNYLVSALETQGDRKIKNASFTKDTVRNANNPVVISDFDQVWGEHVDQMALYHAFTLPLEDFNRVYNYKTSAGLAKSYSVRTLMEDALGKSPLKYVNQLIVDLNGGVRASAGAGFVNNLVALQKKGAVFASMSVVVQQPSSVVRAMAIINPKFFAKGFSWKLYNEAKKYAPVALVKEMGYFDTNLNRGSIEWLMAPETNGIKEFFETTKNQKGVLKSKADDVLSFLPGFADAITWSHIWGACKAEQLVRGNFKKNSEEHLQATAKRFTEVIERTQVYDSVFARSELMRSKDTGVKMATAFMAEPTTAFNMLVDGVREVKTQGKNGLGYLARSTSAFVGATLFNALLKSLVTAGRDDDEEKSYWEKYFGKFAESFISDVNPANLIPFARDIVSLLKGYDVERADMSVASDVISAAQKLFSKMEDDESTWKEYRDVLTSVASLFGIPLRNIFRDFGMVKNIANSEKGTTWDGVVYSVLESIGYDMSVKKLYEEMTSGGSEDGIDFIRRMLHESGKDDEKIDSALKTELKKDDDIIAYAKQYANGNLNALERAMEEFGDLGFNEEDVAAAIRSYADTEVNGEETSYTKTIAGTIYQYDDLYTAMDNGNSQNVNKIIDSVMEGYQAEGKTEKEANAYIRSQLTKTYKPQYVAASNDQRNKIRKALLDTGLYDSASHLDDIISGWLED